MKLKNVICLGLSCLMLVSSSFAFMAVTLPEIDNNIDEEIFVGRNKIEKKQEPDLSLPYQRPDEDEEIDPGMTFRGHIRSKVKPIIRLPKKDKIRDDVIPVPKPILPKLETI